MNNFSLWLLGDIVKLRMEIYKEGMMMWKFQGLTNIEKL